MHTDVEIDRIRCDVIRIEWPIGIEFESAVRLSEVHDVDGAPRPLESGTELVIAREPRQRIGDIGRIIPLVLSKNARALLNRRAKLQRIETAQRVEIARPMT